MLIFTSSVLEPLPVDIGPEEEFDDKNDEDDDGEDGDDGDDE